jgi:hypothetical protein
MRGLRPNNIAGGLPFRISLFISLGLTPLFYFILRSYYKSPSLTPGEMLFIWPYALLCTLNWALAFNTSNRIQGYLPDWLKGWLGRFAVYFVLVLLLVGLLELIRLPAFYDAVIGKSIMFWILPYALPIRRSVRTSAANQAILTSLSGTDENLVLRIKRSKAIFVLIASVAFVAGGISCCPSSRSWVGSVFVSSD